MSGVIHDAWGAVQRLIDHYETQALPSEAPSESMFYGYRPLPLSEFFVGMEVARQCLIERNRCWSGEERFLDVGCGIGAKMVLAQALGWQVEGVERWLPYAAVAQNVAPVYAGEATTFSHYDSFDLVYVYRLCVDLDDERRLVEMITSQMKSGALLFHAGGPDPVGLEHVGDLVWQV